MLLLSYSTNDISAKTCKHWFTFNQNMQYGFPIRKNQLYQVCLAGMGLITLVVIGIDCIYENLTTIRSRP